MLAFALALLGAQQQPAARLEPLTVVSASGHFRAEIARAKGQERVPDALARWTLSVHPNPSLESGAARWSASYPHRATPRWHLLSDDGLAFVSVDREYGESRDLVSIWRTGERQAEFSAALLDLDRGRADRRADGAWLASDVPPALRWGETSAGPQVFLALVTNRGEERFVDLARGALSRTLGELSEPWAEPPASRVGKPGLQVGLPDSCTLPRSIHWGETLEVRVDGHHATPNWMFVGFELARDSEEPGLLVLTPVSAPPPQGTAQTIATRDFSAVARIRGLMPGRYKLRLERFVRPDERFEFEVLPARPYLELRRRGGLAGIDESLRVYPSGVVVDEWTSPPRDPARTYRMLSLAEAERLVDAARALKSLTQPRSATGADFLRCRISVFDETGPRTREFDDVGVQGPERELLELLVR
ncbi:MAG: hypothetical protein FJ298_04045 [Planctomycetes bacterium]|nr:hypothetical protein [Planctomycetota bacterium]